MCKLEKAWSMYLSSKILSTENLRDKSFRYNKNIKPYWQHIDLQSITDVDIVLYTKYLFDLGLSSQSIKHYLLIFRSILKCAIKMKLCRLDLPHFEFPKVNNIRTRYLTAKECELLFTVLHKRSILWHDISLFALQTGMRASEIFSLKTNSINLQEKYLTVFKSKNNTTRRVPLNQIAIEIIKKYLELNLTFLFSNNKINKVSNKFYRAVAETNLNSDIPCSLDKVCFHTLRHTFASWLIQNGIPLATVSQLLGHKTIQMTMRYAHLAPEQGHNAVCIISDTIHSYEMSRKIRK